MIVHFLLKTPSIRGALEPTDMNTDTETILQTMSQMICLIMMDFLISRPILDFHFKTPSMFIVLQESTCMIQTQVRAEEVPKKEHVLF